ncbi:MAG TPA: TonB-dependent receptor [Croceibacterium sp.]
MAVPARAQGVNYAELEDLFGEPVTTSVTGKPQRASEAPASLVIITREDIRRSPAHDIPGLVQAYAGIDVARWMAGQADVAIRGGVRPYNPSLLVLVNGRQVYLDHYGMTNWAGLGVQLEEIQQIEVVMGPNSALFGFNAASGVVNIITIDPLQSQQVTASGGVGTEGQRFASGVAALKLADRLGLRLSGGYETAEEFGGLTASPAAPMDPATVFNPRSQEASAELYAKLGELTESSISLTHSDTDQTEISPVHITIPSHYRFTSAGARISHDAGWGVLSARLFHNWSRFLSASDPSVDFRNEVLVASADALIRAGATDTVRVGIEYRANEIVAEPGYPGATRYDVFAANAMWEKRLGDAATFTLAGRIDNLQLEQDGVVDQPTIFTKADFDRSITDWSFNSALLLQLDDNSSLRLSASRGIEAPSLAALGARLDIQIPGMPFSRVISGNPLIDPAKIWSAEVGLSRMLGESGTRLDLAAYFNHTTDIMALGAPQTAPRAAPPAYPFILSTADNVGSSEAYGLEASAAGRFGGNWHWSLNYTWTHSDLEVAGNSPALITRPLASDSATPEHNLKGQLTYERGPWLATVAARYTSPTEQLVTAPAVPFDVLELVPVAESLAVDAKLAFEAREGVTLAIAGENLTGADGAYLSPAPAERRLRATVRVDF